MVLARLIAILVIVILGSIAAEDVYKLFMSILPLLTVLIIVSALGWVHIRRRYRR